MPEIAFCQTCSSFKSITFAGLQGPVPSVRDFKHSLRLVLKVGPQDFGLNAFTSLSDVSLHFQCSHVQAAGLCLLAYRRAEELNAARGEPLGQDRRHNKYWRFWLEEHPAGDPGAGRLYIESAEDGSFRVLSQKEDLQALMDALERRGAREERLFAELLRQQESLARAMPSQPFRFAFLPLRTRMRWHLEGCAGCRKASHQDLSH